MGGGNTCTNRAFCLTTLAPCIVCGGLWVGGRDIFAFFFLATPQRPRFARVSVITAQQRFIVAN